MSQKTCLYPVPAFHEDWDKGTIRICFFAGVFIVLFLKSGRTFLLLKNIHNMQGEKKMKEKTNRLKPIIAIAAVALLAIIMLFAYNQFKPQGEKGAKKIVIELVIPEQDSKEFTLYTDAEFLRQALDEEQLVKGSESTYGFYITEVNGRVADSAKEEWWSLTKDGVYVETGVDMTPLADGDHYELTLMQGY